MTRDEFYAWLVHGVNANTGFGNQGAMSDEDARIRHAAEHVAAELAPLAGDPFVLYLMRDPLVRAEAGEAFGALVECIEASMRTQTVQPGWVRPSVTPADRWAMFLPARFVERLMSALDPDFGGIAESPTRVGRIIEGAP